MFWIASTAFHKSTANPPMLTALCASNLRPGNNHDATGWMTASCCLVFAPMRLPWCMLTYYQRKISRAASRRHIHVATYSPPKPMQAQVQVQSRCSRCTSIRLPTHVPLASCIRFHLHLHSFTDSLFGFASPSTYLTLRYCTYSTAVVIPACLSVPSARSNHETSFDIFLGASR